MLLVSKIQKGRQLVVSLQDHVPALSPVAAIGAPAGNKFFTAKAAAAFSSISAFDEDFCFIDKFDGSSLRNRSGSSKNEREG
jgi:hypothetical protein